MAGCPDEGRLPGLTSKGESGTLWGVSGRSGFGIPFASRECPRSGGQLPFVTSEVSASSGRFSTVPFA
jgi:hypothetical protein